MAITVFIHGEARPHRSGADGLTTDAAVVPSLTFDTPRIVIGRGEGCDVRLPDPSVAHRHATLRQRGNDWLIIDEGSANGTRVGRVVLAPHAPHVAGASEIVRLGRTWIELKNGHDAPTRQAPVAAKTIALDLVVAGLERLGEDGRPRVTVSSGPDAGKQVVLEKGPVIVGRSRDAALTLDDPDASRQHVEIVRRGDTLVVRDLGSKAGSTLGAVPLGTTEVVWRKGTELNVGANVLTYSFEATDALAELERMPELRVPPSELEIGREPSVTAPAAIDEPGDASDLAAERDGDGDGDDEHGDGDDEPRSGRHPEARDRGRTRWSLTDLAVVVLAFGVFSLSAVGYVVLLK